MAVVWSSEGADDFLTTLAFLGERNEVAAEKLARRVDETLRRLDELPIDGPEVVLRDGQVLRSWPVPPFRAYYVRRGQNVVVVRFYDQRREPIASP